MLRSACRTLLNLSVHDDVKYELVEGQHVEHTLMHMLDENTDDMVRGYVVGVLANVATLQTVKRVLAERDVIATLVRLLDAEQEPIQRQACRAICSLSVDDVLKSALAEYDVIRPLLRCLSVHNYLVAWHACQALANLAVVDKNKDKIIRNNGLTPVVVLVKSSDCRLQKQAARVLFTMTVRSDVRVSVAHMCIGPLVDLLRSEDAGVQRNAVGAVANIAIDPSCVDLLAHTDVVVFVLDLVTDPDTHFSVLKQAVRALFTLSAQPQMSALFLDDMVVAATRHMMVSNYMETSVFHDACGMIANLVLDSRWRRVLAQPAIIRVLARRADKCPRVQTQRQLMRAMCVLSAEPRVAQILAATPKDIQNFIRVLASEDAWSTSSKALVMDADDTIYKYALVTVANLASCEALHRYLARGNCVRHFFKALYAPNSTLEMRHVACDALRKMGVTVSERPDTYMNDIKDDYLRLVNNSILSDVRFVAESRVIYAHRIFIYGRCPRLYEYISTHSATTSPITIPFKGALAYRALLAFMRYLYVDSIPALSSRHLHQVGLLAMQYDVPYLRVLCASRTFAAKRVHSGSRVSEAPPLNMGRSLRYGLSCDDGLSFTDDSEGDDGNTPPTIIVSSSLSPPRSPKRMQGEEQHADWMSPVPLGMSFELGPLNIPRADIPEFRLDCDSAGSDSDADNGRGPIMSPLDEELVAVSTYIDDLHRMVNSKHVPADVQFRTADKAVLYGHKVILCCRSEYFDAMLLSSGMHETHDDDDDSYVDIDASDTVLMAMLRYLYTGTRIWRRSGVSTVSLSSWLRQADDIRLDDDGMKVAADDSINSIYDVPLALLRVSNQFTLSHLQCQCELKLVELLTIDNMFAFWKAASHVRSPMLQAICVHYMLQHAAYIESWDAAVVSSELKAELRDKAKRWSYSVPWSMWSWANRSSSSSSGVSNNCAIQ